MKKVLFSLAALLLLVGWTTKYQTNHGGRPFVVEMTGGPMGDPNGSGVVKLWLNQGQGTIEFETTVEDLSSAPFASHIHLVATGGIVVGLAAPVDGYASGVVSVSKELIKAIRQNPEDYYVNVHTGQYPAGAVTGYLSK